MARRNEKIREASSDELLVQERELTEQIFRLRFQLSTGQAEALASLRDARKDLARVKTHLRAQQLNAWWRAHSGGKYRKTRPKRRRQPTRKRRRASAPKLAKPAKKEDGKAKSKTKKKAGKK